MDKQSVIVINGIRVARKGRGLPITRYCIDELQKRYAELNKPDTESTRSRILFM